MEVIAQTCVVFLNDDPGGLLDGLGPDTTLRRGHTDGSVLQQHIPSVAMLKGTGLLLGYDRILEITESDF